MLNAVTAKTVAKGTVEMRAVMLYGFARVLFGVAALVAPSPAGRLLAGEGGAAPGAQAFLRGIGGREIGVGLGLLATTRARGPVSPWLIAGLLSDSGDIAGIAGAWSQTPPAKRWLGLAMAGAGATTGVALLMGMPATAG